MAAVEVTVSGVLYDKLARTVRPVVLIGEATLTGVGVGGGPIVPPDQPGQPPGIWGPTDPRPTPPIPIYPGGTPNPPGIWPNPPEGQAPIPGHPIVLPGDPSWGPPVYPAHPIVLPTPPDQPPPGGGDLPPADLGPIKAPPAGGGWAYVGNWGWGYFPMGSGPGPKN